MYDILTLLSLPLRRLGIYKDCLKDILKETEGTHPDSRDLLEAITGLEGVEYKVDEVKRRSAIVARFLRGVAAPRSLETTDRGRTTRETGEPGNNLEDTITQTASETDDPVARLSDQLQTYIIIIKSFPESVSEWAKQLVMANNSLIRWAKSFAMAVGPPGLRDEHCDALIQLVEAQLSRWCVQLESDVHRQILPQLSRLLDSTEGPRRLLDALSALTPIHRDIVERDISRSRPTPSLLEASNSYVALHTQLSAELPKYLDLLQRGVTAVFCQFSRLQLEYWAAARLLWSDYSNRLGISQDHSMTSP